MSMMMPWTAAFCRNADRIFAAAQMNSPKLEKLELRFH